jgi:four helix bundle protein
LPTIFGKLLFGFAAIRLAMTTARRSSRLSPTSMPANSASTLGTVFIPLLDQNTPLLPRCVGSSACELRPALALLAQPAEGAVDLNGMLDHERLRVYQVAIAFAELALRIIERIPRGAGKLGDQLFRSSTSIPANIAEGVGKRSKAERRNYYDYARGSAFESGSHLDIVRLLRCVPDEDIDRGKAMLIEIVNVMMRT